MFNTEELLQSKFLNLCIILQSDEYGVPEATVANLKQYIGSGEQSLTAFCRSHITGHHHVDVQAMSCTIAAYAGIEESKRKKVSELIKTYLSMFTAFVC